MTLKSLVCQHIYTRLVKLCVQSFINYLQFVVKCEENKNTCTEASLCCTSPFHSSKILIKWDLMLRFVVRRHPPHHVGRYDFGVLSVKDRRESFLIARVYFFIQLCVEDETIGMFSYKELSLLIMHFCIPVSWNKLF